MAGRRWTNDETNELRDLIGAGLTQREIGRKLGRTEQAIANRCKKVGIHNPEAAKLNAVDGQRRVMRDPFRDHARRRKISASWTPERRKRQSEIGRVTFRKNGLPEKTSEGKERSRQGVKAWHKRRFAWLPDQYREEYRRLVHRRKIKAAQAKEMILARMADEMTLFDRQMHALKNGARLIEKPVMPRKSYDHILIGNATALCAEMA